ncbi:MAG: serine/threonine protein kinase [Candidatus Sericytochromatia bacterium]
MTDVPLPSASPSSLIAGRYQVLRTLAQGSDLRTDEVCDTHTDSVCILKTLSLHQLQDWKRLELFKREARTLAHLQHPQIPALLAYFETRSADSLSCYLVLEKVPGQNLAERVREGLHLEEHHAYLIAQQVLRILDYLHRFHPPVVHRDIKPSNLVLDEEGVLYLIDFGGVQEALGMGGSTLIGTYGYMAPEQFAGKALPASDLYGLGATLVYLLSGREPSQLPQQDLLLQFRAYVSCSARFANWIEHLLLPAPEQRFQTALEALEVLREILPIYRHLSLPALQKEVARAVVDLAALEQEDTRPASQSEVPVSHHHAPGTILRQYSIVGVLGEGDIAVTYAAQREDGLPVVIRELHFDRLTRWKSYELFERELKTLGRLKHPALPRLLDHFEIQTPQQHRFYLVSERLGGQTLEQRLRQGWRPLEPEVRALGSQLLKILCFLQEQDPPLIHRDIKPSNLLLDEAGQLYLIDFGAVTEAFRLQGGGGSTVIGTFGYMAPEQFVGKAVPQSDLYGTAATLLHLLAGRSPAEMPQQALRLQFADQVRCSRPFYLWLEQMLDPTVSQRFASSWQALETLNKLNHLPVVSDHTRAQAASVVGKDAKAIAIQEGYDGLELVLHPMSHDYKILLGMMAGGNLVLTTLLSHFAAATLVPEMFWFWLLTTGAMIGGSAHLLRKVKHAGENYETRISVNAEWLHYITHLKKGDAEPVCVESFAFPVRAIKSLRLGHDEYPNRLSFHVQDGQQGRLILRVSQYPIANTKTKARYLVERLEETVRYYQRQAGA